MYHHTSMHTGLQIIIHTNKLLTPWDGSRPKELEIIKEASVSLSGICGRALTLSHPLDLYSTLP